MNSKIRKTCFITALMILSSVYTYAQHAGLSPFTKSLLFEHGKSPFIKDMKVSSEQTISGLMLIDESNLPDLSKIDIVINTRAGNIWTFRCSKSALSNLSATRGVKYIQVDEPIKVLLDSARSQTGLDRLASENIWPDQLDGSGVIIGIVDFGFDFTHPTLYDSDGENYRVKSAWVQELDTGISPLPFGYGSEFRGKQELLESQKGISNISHGLHVAGIAAGSGLGTNGKFRGAAPNAELVLIEPGLSDEQIITTGQSGLVDAIQYVFSIAEAEGKPAIINFSLGNMVGPHDGTSLFDQACDNLIGPGRLLVGAVANSGYIDLHIDYTFTEQDTSFQTFVEFTSRDFTYIDGWGEPNTNHCVSFSLFNDENELLTDKSDTFCTASSGFYQPFLIGIDEDTCFIQLSQEENTFNNKSRTFIAMSKKTTDSLVLSVLSNEGRVNFYNVGGGLGLPFKDNYRQGYIKGSTAGSIAEIGGTGRSMISVGAYRSKSTYVDFTGTFQNFFFDEGSLTGFTSLGPTVDGRVKPLITGPGERVTSAVSNFETSRLPGGEIEDLQEAEITFQGVKYYYGTIDGTSMSSPLVAGALALQMQHNPLLTYAEAVNIIKSTAIEDEFTGDLPLAGSNSWGWGKLNAYDVALAGYSPTAIEDFQNHSELVGCYPNPAIDILSCFVKSKAKIKSGHVYNLMGKKVQSLPIFSGEDFTINLENLPSGLYMIHLTDENGTHYLEKIKKVSK